MSILLSWNRKTGFGSGLPMNFTRAGHLIEAAVAYQGNATGRDRFLRAMCRYADCIARVFMEEQAPPFATPGHEEIELALVKLYRCTGEERYLRLARWFLDQRGNNDKDPACMGEWENPRYTQSHLPVRRQFTAEGHAVRAGYLYSAMADVAYETGDPELRTACQSLFENITERRMYITGGMGSSRTGEAFTRDFDLPNATAYTETCAAISLILFAQRMLLLDIDGRYADVVERALYNGFLSGLSLDGRSFFTRIPWRSIWTAMAAIPRSREGRSCPFLSGSRFRMLLLPSQRHPPHRLPSGNIWPPTTTTRSSSTSTCPALPAGRSGIRP